MPTTSSIDPSLPPLPTPEGSYYFKSGYANNACVQNGTDPSNVEAWTCDETLNSLWTVSCNDKGGSCQISHGSGLDFVFSDTNSFIKISTTPAAAVVVKSAWAHVDANCWIFVQSNTYYGYKIKSANDPTKCITILDTSTDPINGTSMAIQGCNDSGDVNPQDFTLIPFKVQVQV